MLLARRNSDDTQRQALAEHCACVAELSEGFLNPLGLSSCGSLLGYLHDYGKIPRNWQLYLLEKNPHKKIPHAMYGAIFLEHFVNADVPLRKALAQLIGGAISGHHSGLHDMLSTDGKNEYSAMLEKPGVSDNEAAVFFEECIASDKLDSLFKEALQEFNEKSRKIFEGFSHYPNTNGIERNAANNGRALLFGLLCRLFASCLIDADRLDAARWETGFLEKERTGKELWTEMEGRLEARLRAFSPSAIGTLRGKISDECLAAAEREQGIYRLFVPTGGGKTLSALRFGLRHAKKHGLDRIIYIAPFTVILEQTAKELRKAICSDGEVDSKQLVLEIHSSLIEEFDDCDEGIARARYAERFNAPIIVTTQVAFLDSLFSARTSHIRRMHMLSRSVIIFDEVQTLPIKCINLFNLSAQFLTDVCGCTCVLCTATQSALTDTGYPIRLAASPQLIEDTQDVFNAFSRTKIIDARGGERKTASQLADFVQERQAKNILIILNTKQAVLNLYRELKSRGADGLCHLSTSMCPAHRLLVIEKLRGQLANSEAVICISTNLIEAGVDISFDCVIRSLSGLDSIAQAAGRCNRHGDFPCREVFIIESCEEHIAPLKDLQLAQDAARRVLAEYNNNPEALGNDLISPAAIQRYYLYYFTRQREAMSYNLPASATGGIRDITLLDLLGSNSKIRRGAEHLKEPPLFLYQSFQTAGREFRVIEDNTIGVIVPFDDAAKGIISELRCGRDIYKNLRLAQKYSVNLFEYQKCCLYKEGALEHDNDVGFWVLDERWYDSEAGILTDKRATVEEYII